MAFFDSSNKVNAIHLTFAKELGFSIKPIDVGAQKIDGTMLNNFEIVVAAYSVADKANWVRFFEKTFLRANISPEAVFGILFLILSGADIDFLGRKLRWRTYITKKALLTIRRVEQVGKKEFAATVLDSEHKTYIVYTKSVNSILSPSFSLFDVHLSCRSQIVGLIAEKASTKVSAEYSDFADVFSPDLAFKLPEHTEIYNHAIKLVND